MQAQSLGWEDPLEKEMATRSSILTWEIPWAEEAGGLQSVGLQKSRTRLSTAKQEQEGACVPCTQSPPQLASLCGCGGQDY